MRGLPGRAKACVGNAVWVVLVDWGMADPVQRRAEGGTGACSRVGRAREQGAAGCYGTTVPHVFSAHWHTTPAHVVYPNSLVPPGSLLSLTNLLQTHNQCDAHFCMGVQWEGIHPGVRWHLTATHCVSVVYVRQGGWGDKMVGLDRLRMGGEGACCSEQHGM